MFALKLENEDLTLLNQIIDNAITEGHEKILEFNKVIRSGDITEEYGKIYEAKRNSLVKDCIRLQKIQKKFTQKLQS